MNSLNILSARVSPPPSRSNSYGNILAVTESRRGSREDIFDEKDESPADTTKAGVEDVASEGTPLLEKDGGERLNPEPSGWNIIHRISGNILDSFRWILSTLAAPGVYLIACLYNDRGTFAPFSQIGKLGAVFTMGSRRASAAHAPRTSALDKGSPLEEHNNGKSAFGRRASTRISKGLSSSSSSSGMSSESESDRDRSMSETDQPTSSGSGRQTRLKGSQNSDEIAPARRSIRIKLHNEDSLRQRKQRKSTSASTQSNGSGAIPSGEISAATLKSPTSPAASLLMTKYPRAPAPPRPLIPSRQPLYTLSDAPSARLTQKTLILDLDETLIHSMAKGGRMSTGHMVEVKLNMGTGGNTSVGSQHPILYYVHKRPHCDDFLRRVSGP
jgi:CTD nuclear envelope phosphatase 1